MLTAEQLRGEAERALAEGRFDDALMAWTRAIARDAESRTLLPDARSMTAHEVGAALAVAFPAQVADISRTMDRFDAVAYGDQAASREDATNARSTDAALHAARPVLSPRSARGSRGGDRPPPPPTTSAAPVRASRTPCGSPECARDHGALAAGPRGRHRRRERR